MLPKKISNNNVLEFNDMYIRILGNSLYILCVFFIA